MKNCWVVDLAGKILLLHEEERAEAAAARVWCGGNIRVYEVFSIKKANLFEQFFGLLSTFFSTFRRLRLRKDIAGPHRHHHAVVEPVAAERKRPFQTHPGNFFELVSTSFFQSLTFSIEMSKVRHLWGVKGVDINDV